MTEILSGSNSIQILICTWEWENMSDLDDSAGPWIRLESIVVNEMYRLTKYS